jgi:hypothetical protein
MRGAFYIEDYERNNILFSLFGKEGVSLEEGIEELMDYFEARGEDFWSRVEVNSKKS